MHLSQRIKRSLLRRLLPVPVAARHAEYSMLFSADDAVGPPSPRLISLALDAVRQAQTVSLEQISARMTERPHYPDIWPGENYKLLAGFMRVLAPTRVVEVGTGGGSSTLAMQQGLPPDGRMVTFDILGWRDWPGCLLREEDFQDGRLSQSTDDLTDPVVFAKHRALFEEAELIFFDAAKDGVMEQTFIDALLGVSCRRPPIVVFDDIRLWNMLRIWRRLPLPKLDLTSFGHWTGTGVVEWDLSKRSLRPSGVA